MATAGTPQSATINTAFATQLQATVRDASSNPVNGVTVTFTAPTSGASGTFAGGVNTAVTNAQGVATAAIFTANNTAGGPYNVTASVAGVSTPANFSLTNLAGAPASITATAGTPQSATINTQFATQLQATVRDASNNPVNGVTVTFTAPTSGASGTFASGVNTATTNAQGVALAAIFTANSTAGGPYNVTASVAGVGTSANFSLSNLPPGSSIGLVQHTSRDAGTTNTSTLAFVSPNTAGNWIAVAIRAGSSSSQVFAVSDSNANTYRRAFQLGITASAFTFAIFYAENIKGGANTVSISDTVSGPFRFAILEYSGVATSNSLDVTAVTQGNSTSPNSGSLSPTANGDLLLGAIVTQNPAAFTAGSGYTIEEFAPAEPNTKLIAEDQIQATAGLASAGALLAASDNWGAGLAAFKAAVGAAGSPSNITATAGTPQSATVSTAFVTQLQATVKDPFNSPVSGVTVTFTAPTSGASGTFAGGVNTATTNAQGVAIAAIFTANGTAGGPYNVTASVAGVSTPANFSLTNLAGAPASITATAGTPQSATINTQFATQLQATVRDASNNPVNGVTVTFTAPTSGASGTFAGGINTAVTNAQGVATAAVFTANGTAGGPYNVTAAVAGVTTPASFSLTNAAPGSAIALVQHTSRDAGTTTTSTLAFVSPNTAGNWIAVAIRAGSSSAQVFTVTDSNANTYRRAFQLGLTATQVTLAIFYAENIKGGANTITVSDTVSGPFRFATLEYSGVATSNSLDVTVTGQGTSTSPNSGNLTPTASGDLLLGTIVTQNPAVFTAASGYTVEEFVPAEPNTKLVAEDQIQATAAIASAGVTLAASDNWAR